MFQGISFAFIAIVASCVIVWQRKTITGMRVSANPTVVYVVVHPSSDVATVYADLDDAREVADIMNSYVQQRAVVLPTRYRRA